MAEYYIKSIQMPDGSWKDVKPNSIPTITHDYVRGGHGTTIFDDIFKYSRVGSIIKKIIYNEKRKGDE